MSKNNHQISSHLRTNLETPKWQAPNEAILGQVQQASNQGRI